MQSFRVRLKQFLPLMFVTAVMGAGAVFPAASETITPPAAATSTDPGVKKTNGLMVVLIYDDSCKAACTLVKPVVRDLAQERSDQVEYIELNTGTNTIKDALKKAKELKITAFVSDRTEEVPVVGIFNCRKLLKELVGHKTKEVYKEALEKALQKVGH